MVGSAASDPCSPQSEPPPWRRPSGAPPGGAAPAGPCVKAAEGGEGGEGQRRSGRGAQVAAARLMRGSHLVDRVRAATALATKRARSLRLHPAATRRFAPGDSSTGGHSGDHRGGRAEGQWCTGKRSMPPSMRCSPLTLPGEQSRHLGCGVGRERHRHPLRACTAAQTGHTGGWGVSGHSVGRRGRRIRRVGQRTDERRSPSRFRLLPALRRRSPVRCRGA